MRVLINPRAEGEDTRGDGGVRRVIEGMQRHLPKYGVELVERPDDAELFACHIQIDAAWLKRWPERAFVAHNHGLYWGEFDWGAGWKGVNKDVMEALRVADAITAPTEWVAQAIRRHTCRDVTVVPHGIDAADWHGKPEQPPYVLWDKTRVDPVCTPGPLFDVARLLPDARFVTTIDDDGGLPNVAAIGRQGFEAAKALVEGASVYLATVRETFGIATLQAMAAGVPVAGWDWGGTRDIGLAFPARAGDPEELAAVVRMLLTDDVKWAQARHHGLETAAEFTWDAAAERYAELYSRVLEEKRIEREGPRVSVVVTAYNLEKYLPDTLNSVLAQSSADWECIIVDDASPDRCGEIADGFAAADSRFRVVHNERNQYLAGARNTGVAAAKGRYVFPLDADDMIMPRTLQVLADALDADRAIDIAYGGVMFLKEDGRTPETYANPSGQPYPAGTSGWPDPAGFRYDRQVRGFNQLPYASMFRRRAHTLTGGYRRRCVTAEDADFWTRLSSYGFRPRMVTTAPTLVYRNREGSMSRVHGQVRWQDWFPGSRDLARSPAGAERDTLFASSPGATKGATRRPDFERTIPEPFSFDPPAISVVIPVGPGHEGLVMDAIDSVEAQHFQWWECIVVNDSGAELPPMPTWVRVVQVATAEPQGVAAARNSGVMASRGRWYLPLDADDLLEPQSLSTLFEVGMERPEDVIAFDFYQDVATEESSAPWTVYHCPPLDETKLIANGAIHPVTSLVPKAAWEKVGGYEDVGWEDWVFQIRCVEECICTTQVPLPLFSYRKHTGQRRDVMASSEKPARQAEMERRFPKYWKGGQPLAGCRSCGSRGHTPAVASMMMTTQSAQASVQGGSGVLVTYIGGNSSFRVRGPSGTTYRFQSTDTDRTMYVHDVDAEFLLQRRDFEAARAAPEVRETPVLVSANPEAGVPAGVADPGVEQWKAKMEERGAEGSDSAPSDDAAGGVDPGVEESEAPDETESQEPGLSKAVAEALKAAGYGDVPSIMSATDEELLAVEGVGPKTLERIRSLFKPQAPPDVAPWDPAVVASAPDPH